MAVEVGGFKGATGALSQFGTKDFTSAEISGTPKAYFMINTALLAVSKVHEANMQLALSMGTTTAKVLGSGNYSQDAITVSNSGRHAGTSTAEFQTYEQTGNSDVLKEDSADVDLITSGIRLTALNGFNDSYHLGGLLFGGSDFEAQLVTFTPPTDGTPDVTTFNTKFTSLSGSPELIILLSHRSGADDSIKDHFSFTMGVIKNENANFGTGSNITQWSMNWYFPANQAFTSKVVACQYSKTRYFANLTPSQLHVAFECTDILSDGITSTFRDSEVTPTGGGRDIHALGMKFNGEVDIAADFLTVPTATGTQSDTSLGFKPKVMIHGMSFETDYDQHQNEDDGTEPYTFAVNLVYEESSVIEYFSVCGLLDPATTADCETVGSDSDIYLEDNDNSTQIEGVIDSWDGSSVEYDWTAVDTSLSHDIFRLIIGDPSTAATLDVSTSDVVQASDTLAETRQTDSNTADTIEATDLATETRLTDSDTSDNIEATDSPDATSIIDVNTSDTVESSDLASATRRIDSSTSDTLEATDQATESAIFPESHSDIVESTDATSETALFPIDTSDTIEAADSSSETAIFAESLQDTLEATDEASSTLSLDVNTSDTAEATDSSSESWSLGKSTADVMEAVDSTSETASFQEDIQDTVEAVDALSESAIFPESTSDISEAVDSISSSISLDVNVDDTVEATDSVVESAYFAKDLSDTLEAVDSSNETRQTDSSIADIVEAAESVSETSIFPVDTSDTAESTDTFSGESTQIESTEDTLEASDSFSSTLDTQQNIADVAEVVDAASVTRVIDVQVADTVEATDLTSNTVSFSVSVVDGLVGSDQAGVATAVDVSASDMLLAVDDGTETALLWRSSSDTVTVVDTASSTGNEIFVSAQDDIRAHDGAAIKLRDLIELESSISNDFSIFDNLVTVQYTQADRNRYLTGDVTLTTPKTVPVMCALSREIQENELLSNGQLQKEDVRWEIPVSLLPFDPRVGDWLVDPDGKRWNVVAVDSSTLNTRYRIYARN